MTNVYTLRPHSANRTLPTPPTVNRKLRASPFDQMTDHIIMEQAKAGTLNPAVVEALLAAVRSPSREATR